MSNPLEKVKSMKQKAIKNNIPKWNADIRFSVGMSTCEIAAGSKKVYDTLLEEIKKSYRIFILSNSNEGCSCP